MQNPFLAGSVKQATQKSAARFNPCGEYSNQSESFTFKVTRVCVAAPSKRAAIEMPGERWASSKTLPNAAANAIPRSSCSQVEIAAQTGQFSPGQSCRKCVAISTPETTRTATKMPQRMLVKSFFFRFIIVALLSFIPDGCTFRSGQARSCFRCPAIRSHRFSAV